MSAEERAAPAGDADDVVEVKLRRPLEVLGESVEVLRLRPSVRAFRNFALPMKGDGEDATIMFEPYAMARVGLKMAGQPDQLLDKLHPSDMWEVASAVLGFIEPGRGAGLTISR